MVEDKRLTRESPRFCPDIGVPDGVNQGQGRAPNRYGVLGVTQLTFLRQIRTDGTVLGLSCVSSRSL